MQFKFFQTKFVLFLWLIAGCSSVPLKLDPKVMYKRDMKISFDGQSYSGVAVLPDKASHEITIETKGKLDLLTITTCHREFTAENLSSGGIFGKNKYTFLYAPIPGIEDEYCPIDIGGYEALKGRHSWGFLDMKTKGENVEALLHCNGELKNVSGVSVCQSKLGLVEKINFSQEMAVAPSENCKTMISPDLKSYEFEVAPGVCVYKFRSRDNQYHRLTTIGYEDIVIRENP